MVRIQCIILTCLMAGCSSKVEPHWWSPVWSVEGHVAVGDQDGFLVSKVGIQQAPAWIGRCGSWRTAKTESGGVLQVPNGSPVTFLKAPAVQAAVVERAAWRLGEYMGGPKGIEMGGSATKSPSEHRGIRVRSVRKTRRQGPPWMVVVGQREEQIGVALTDKLALESYAGLVLEVPEVASLRLRTLPVFDLNQDGQEELVLFADGADGSGIRIVLNVDMSDAKTLSVDGIVTQGPIHCGR